MSESRLTLKHPTGFFAAGGEMRDAMAMLSDGGFKLYVYVSLNADRQTAQLRFRMAECLFNTSSYSNATGTEI